MAAYCASKISGVWLIGVALRVTDVGGVIESAASRASSARGEEQAWR